MTPYSSVCLSLQVALTFTRTITFIQIKYRLVTVKSIIYASNSIIQSLLIVKKLGIMKCPNENTYSFYIDGQSNAYIDNAITHSI
jgi:hypothetical protein